MKELGYDGQAKLGHDGCWEKLGYDGQEKMGHDGLE